MSETTILGTVRDALAALHATLVDPHAASAVNQLNVLEGLHTLLLEQVLPADNDDDGAPADGLVRLLDVLAEVLFVDARLSTIQHHQPAAPATADAATTSATAAQTALPQQQQQHVPAETVTLLRFVEQAVSPEAISQGTINAKAVKEALAICTDVCQRVGTRLQRHVLVAIRRTALDLFTLLNRIKAQQAVQAECLRTLLHIVCCSKAILSPMDLDAMGLLKLAIRTCGPAASASQTGQTVRGIGLQLIGSLMRLHPVDVSSESGDVLKAFLGILKLQAERPEPEMTTAEGLLMGLTDYLDEFAATVDEGASYLGVLFRFISSTFILAAENMSRYAMAHAALDLLMRHALLFKEYVASDAVPMTGRLLLLCGHKNVPLHKRAFPAASAFLQAVSLELCTGSRLSLESRRDTLVGLLNILKAALAGTRYEVSFAVTAYGLIARPIVKFIGIDAFQRLMTEVMQQCDAILSRGQDEIEEATTHLFQFVNTYACFLLEDGLRLHPSHVDAIQSLLQTVALVYPMPYNFPALRRNTGPAVLRLLTACTRHAELQAIAPAFVQQLLLLSCASSDVFAERSGGGGGDGFSSPAVAPTNNEHGGASADPDQSQQPAAMAQQQPSPDDGALFGEYAPLWRALLQRASGGAPNTASYVMRLSSWGFPWDSTSGITENTVSGVAEGIRTVAVTQIVEMVQSFDLAVVTLTPTQHQQLSASQQQQQQHHHQTASVAVPTGTLAAHEAHSGTLASAGGILAPRNGKDFNLMLNLTQLFGAIAPALLPPAAAPSWAIHVTEPLVAKGTLNAHVSGLFTMLGHVAAQLSLHDAFTGVGSNSGSSSGGDEHDTTLRPVQALLSRYVGVALSRLADTSMELRVACLRFVLACPMGRVASAAQTRSAIVAALEVGLVHGPAAVAALDRLLAWLDGAPGIAMRELIPSAVPWLRKFAASTSSAASGGGASSGDDSSSSAAILDRVLLVLTRDGVAQVAAASSSQASSTALSSGEQQAVGEGLLLVSSSKRPVELSALGPGDHRNIRIRLPFRDASIDLPLDPLLPRITQLALRSPDRQARIAACELLHAIVVWLIGSTASAPASYAAGGGGGDGGVAMGGGAAPPVSGRPDDTSASTSAATKQLAPILRALVPLVVSLAVGEDPVPRQLFGPLLGQVSRWFAQTSSDAAHSLLDGLVAGLVEPRDSALRSMAAEALREFVKWSVDAAASGPNLRHVLLRNGRLLFRRLFSLCTHPDASCRMGAAVGLNALLSELEHVEELVSEHALDAVHFALQALAASSTANDDEGSSSDSTNESGKENGPVISAAAAASKSSTQEHQQQHHGTSAAAPVQLLQKLLKDLEKIVVLKAGLLLGQAPSHHHHHHPTKNDPHGAAVRPAAPVGTRAASRMQCLADLVEWLFEQSNSVATEARHTAMRLFATFVTCLPGYATDDGPMRWLSVHRHSRGTSFFDGMFAAFSMPTPHKAADPGVALSLQKFRVWARELHASLECHDWLILARLLPAGFAFGQRKALTSAQGATVALPSKQQQDDEVSCTPLFLTPADQQMGAPVGAQVPVTASGDDELLRSAHKHHRAEAAANSNNDGATTTKEPRLPKSQLLLHLHYFVVRLANHGALKSGPGVDSQTAWVTERATIISDGNASASPASKSEGDDAVALCQIAVLEAMVPLLDMLIAKYPSTVWLPDDDEVGGRSAPRPGDPNHVPPVLHRALFEVFAQAVLKPWALFPRILSDVVAHERLTAVGEAGLAVLWRAATANRHFESLRPAIVAAIRDAVSFNPSDVVAIARSAERDPQAAHRAVSGYRCAHRIGCLAPALLASSSATPPSNDQVIHLAKSVFVAVQELVCGPDPRTAALAVGTPHHLALPRTQGGRRTHPLAVRTVRELMSLSDALGLPVSAVVAAIVDDSPATNAGATDGSMAGSGGASSAGFLLGGDSMGDVSALRRTATLSGLSSVAAATTSAAATRGGRLVRVLAKEVEALLGRTPADALKALLPFREVHPGVVFDTALTLCQRCAGDPAALASFMESWPAFSAPLSALSAASLPSLGGGGGGQPRPRSETQMPGADDDDDGNVTGATTGAVEAAAAFNSFELLDFRLTALRVLSSHGYGPVAVRPVARHVQHDVIRCLSGTTAGDASPEAGTYTKHRLLYSRKAIRLLSLACEIAPIAVGADDLDEKPLPGQPSTSGATQPTNFVARLAAAVSEIIRDEFPAVLSELKEGSAAHDAYLEIVQALIILCERTPRPQVLLALLPLLRYDQHDLFAQLRRAVARCVRGMSPGGRMETCQLALELQGGALPADIRSALTVRILLPALRSMSQPDAEQFFCGQVKQLVADISDNSMIVAAPKDTNSDLCIRRAGSFVLLESMYRLCTQTALKGRLNQIYVGANSATASGKELTERVIKASMAAKSTRPPATANGDEKVDPTAILRYRQAAYSCLVAVVMATQRQEKFFSGWLLQEKAHDLWHAIVDLNATHQFAIESRARHQVDSIDDIHYSAADIDDDGAVRDDADDRNDVNGGGGGGGGKRNAMRRMKYLASQYLQDSNINPAAGSPPVATDGGSDMDSAYAATPSGMSTARRTPGGGADRAHAISVGMTASPLGVAAARVGSLAPHRQEHMARALQYKLSLVAAAAAGGGGTQAPGDTPRRGAPMASPAAFGDVPLFSFASNDGLTPTSGGGGPDGSSAQQQQQQASALVPAFVEADGLWRGVCGSTVMRLLNHLAENFKPAATDRDSSAAVAYTWANPIVSVLKAHDTHVNVKLTLARIVCLCPAVFEASAHELLPTLAQLATMPTLGTGLHVFARDVCLTLLRWRTPHPAPHSPTEEAAAKSLLTHVIRSVSHASKLVFRENLELAKCLIERWCPRIPVPKRDVASWLAYDKNHATAKAARMCGVQLCGVIAASQLPLFDAAADAMDGLTADSVARLLVDNFGGISRDVSLAAAEVAGMFLSAASAAPPTPSTHYHPHPHGGAGGDAFQAQQDALQAAVGTKLMGLFHEASPNTFLPLLAKVASRYPPAVDQFLPARLLQLWSAAGVPDRVMMLELIARRGAALAADTYHALSSRLLATIATLPDDVRVATTRVLLAFTPSLDEDALVHLATKWIPLLQQPLADASTDARVVLFELAIEAHTRLSRLPTTALPPALAEDLAVFLARGFTDPCLYIRDLLIRYWDDESRLPFGSLERLSTIVSRLPAARIGSSWLQHAAVLTLAATHRSPDFLRRDAIFSEPLSRCVFRTEAIDLSAAVRTLPLTPMFATQAQTPIAQLETGLPASLGGTPVSLQRAAAGAIETLLRQGAPTGSASATPAGGIAAHSQQKATGTLRRGTFASYVPRRSLAAIASATPSSSVADAAEGTAPAFGDSLMLFNTGDGANSAARQLRPRGTPATVSAITTTATGAELRRRFPVVREQHQTRRHILYKAKAAQQRNVIVDAERRLHDNFVHLYREYRSGDVPDVQVSIQAFVVPLQALALADEAVSRTLMALLSEGILGTARALVSSTPTIRASPHTTSAGGPGLGGGAAGTIPVSVSLFATVNNGGAGGGGGGGAATVAIRQMQEDVRTQLQTLLADAAGVLTTADRGLVEYAHEQLILDPAALETVDPAIIVASCARTGAFKSGVILLERRIAVLDVKRSSVEQKLASGNNSDATGGNHDANLPAQLDALLDAVRATWLQLFLLLSNMGEESQDAALAVARRTLPNADALAEVATKLRTGDGDAALARLREVFDAVSSGAVGDAPSTAARTTVTRPHVIVEDAANNDDDDDDDVQDASSPKQLRLEAVRSVQRSALAALQRWDDVADSFEPPGVTDAAAAARAVFSLTPSSVASGSAVSIGQHAMRQYVAALARSSEADRRRQVLAAPASATAELPFERALVLFEAQRFDEAARACDTGLRHVMRRWAIAGNDATAAFGDATELQQLQQVASVRAAAMMLLARRPNATRLAVDAQRTFRTWRAAAIASGASTALGPAFWFDQLLARDTVGSRLLQRLEAAQESIDVNHLRDVVAASAGNTSSGAAAIATLTKDFNRAVYTTALTAGARLLSDPATNLAAKRLLERAIAVSSQGADPSALTADSDGRQFDMSVWGAVVRSTITRSVRVQDQRGDRLRKNFGDIQNFMRGKSAKVNFDATPLLQRQYAGLQATFWAALSQQIVDTEGSASIEEVVPMATKCIKKYATSIGVSTLQAIATMPTAAASGGDRQAMELLASQSAAVKEYALYTASMLDYLVRSAGSTRDAQHNPVGRPAATSDAAEQLKGTLAVATVVLLLRSMSVDGDGDARRSFPRVLQALSASPKACDEFARLAPTIPTWTALPWSTLLLSSLLSAKSADAVAPLVDRLAAHYPQVVFYPYRCIESELAAVAASRSAADVKPSTATISKLHKLSQDPALTVMRAFSSSLHKLHHPELRFRSWFDDIKSSTLAYRDAAATHGPSHATARKRAQEVQHLWELCFTDCFDATQPGIGTYNRKFAQDWWAPVKRDMSDNAASNTQTIKNGSAAGAVSLDYDRIRRAGRIADEMRNKIVAKDWMSLTAFSEALATMQLSGGRGAASYVECPIQPFRFLGAAVPIALPRIAAVDSNLLVMSSLQRPKRLTLSTNASDRPVAFLVKGGDDLRLDQRIEELFETVNFALTSAKAATTTAVASTPYLRVYSVIPVSKKAGLVEWVSNTEPMKAAIERSMHNDASLSGRAPSVERHPSTIAYHTFVTEVEGHQRELNLHQRYLAMFRAVRNRRGEHAQRFQDWVRGIDPNYLRDGIMSYATSQVEWFDVRRRFTLTTGAMAAAGYVLGVGDRHLQNFLLDRTNGDNIAIDFGHAFGSATASLGIPELMPFRMTAQMVRAFGVLGTDAVAPAIEATLSAAQRHRAAITSLLAVFLDEPLSGWESRQELKGAAPAGASPGVSSSSDADAHAGAVTGSTQVSEAGMRKVGTVHRKLAMEHPVKLLAEEVAANPHVARMKVTADVNRVLEGEPVKREGLSRLGSAAEQTSVLLSMATDPNLLGRTWIGWAPLF